MFIVWYLVFLAILYGIYRLCMLDLRSPEARRRDHEAVERICRDLFGM